MRPAPIEVRTDGAVSAAAVAWRSRGRLRLTVVVKATFSIVPDGVAALAPPHEICAEDRTFEGNPARSVEHPSDLAPYLAQCDVTLTGHAYSPGGKPAPSGAVRIGIARGERALLDKTLHVYGNRSTSATAPEPFARVPLVYERALGGPGEPNPVGVAVPNVVDARDPTRPGGFGPLSRFWGVRKRLLGGIDRRVIDAPSADIPDEVPWAYFQAAPADQRIEHLLGGEWLVLDGLHPSLARVQTRLPLERAAARVQVGAQPPIPVDLACDMLVIDGDRQVFTLSWRGQRELDDERTLAEARVFAAFEVAPIDWDRLVAQGGRSAAEAPSPGGDATLPLTGAPRPPVIPFVAAGVAVGEGTFDLRAEQHALARDRPVAPFPLPLEAGPRPLHEPVPGAPWSPVAAAPAPTLPVGEGTLLAALASTSAPSAPPTVSPAVVAAQPAIPPPAPRADDGVVRAVSPVGARREPTRKETEALVAQLKSAGASDEDVAALQRALRPPSPPPDDDGG